MPADSAGNKVTKAASTSTDMIPVSIINSTLVIQQIGETGNSTLILLSMRDGPMHPKAITAKSVIAGAEAIAGRLMAAHLAAEVHPDKMPALIRTIQRSPGIGNSIVGLGQPYLF